MIPKNNAMHLGVNLSNALQQLESVKAAVDQSDDPKLKAATADDLGMLMSLLDSPILRSIATLHDSVGMLSTQVAHHPSILPADFDITPAGELALQSRSLYPEGEEEQRVPQLGDEDSDSSPQHGEGLPELGAETDSIVGSDWAQVEVIDLVNDGTGLGFGIIGARTRGVIVKTILAGGVADRDQRLRSGDHILQIGEVSLLEMGSEQVAGVLRASGTRVRLVVARPGDPALTQSPATLVPARLVSSPESLDRYLVSAGVAPVFSPSRFVSDPAASPPPDADAESPEVDRFTVQLKKDENGLGITIAGYVCEKEELSGIFVKSVSSGSAAALCGAVRVNDRIVAVDGVSLAGRSNQRAVDVLKRSGSLVTLQLERYLRGPKYEQLQQAIAAGEGGGGGAPASPSLSPSPSHNPFLTMHRPSPPPSPAPAPPSAPPPDDIPMTCFTSTSRAESARSAEREESAESAEFVMPREQAQRDAIRERWQAALGPSVEVVVGLVQRGGGGLGISLEGTVDVEGGREVRPHHYVRSVLPEGPVGRGGAHRPGDELLGESERPPAARDEPSGGGVHPQGPVQRGVHGVRAPPHRAAAGQGQVRREPGGRGAGGARRGAPVAEPGAADGARHVVSGAAGDRVGEGGARARVLHPGLPGPAAPGALAGRHPVAGPRGGGPAGRETHPGGPPALRQPPGPAERDPGGGGGGPEGRPPGGGAHRSRQAPPRGGRRLAAAVSREPI